MTKLVDEPLRIVERAAGDAERVPADTPDATSVAARARRRRRRWVLAGTWLGSFWQVNAGDTGYIHGDLAFELKEGPGQGPLIRARGQDYTLPEISAFVLKRTRQIAETALGGPVERAVITVPAHFNELQRASTKVAGRVSGLEVLRILNEPTAAALAYGAHRVSDRRRLIAVFDLGGGTFDISIISVENGVFEVLSTGGDTALGGEDWV